MVENERKDDNTGDSGGKSPKKLRVLLRTFGCQMNVRDSEVVMGLLQTQNYKLTTDPEEADIIIINTCSVRQHAEERVWSELGRFKKGQSPRKDKKNAMTGTVPIIGIIGCMAQNYKDKVFERAPNVDFVVGPSDIDKIPKIIQSLQGQSPSGTVPSALFQRKIWETDGTIRPEEIYHTGFYENKERAYAVISEGCSNYCSYCVVPYVRGELHQRNYKDILKEIEGAAERGITKITLLGQNVNAYRFSVHGSELIVDFVQLLKMVNEIKGLKEFSFVTSHPKDTSRELFKVMADTPKLKKSLHLPVQSGSDRILKLMNRGYDRKFYLDLADNYRRIVKGGLLSTDIIVGFPSETEAEFEDTRKLVEEVKFDAAYIFKYSPRPHTEAEKLVDDVPREEKEKRHKIILDLQKDISNNKNAKKSR